MKLPEEIEKYSRSFAPASLIEAIVRDCAKVIADDWVARHGFDKNGVGKLQETIILSRYGLESKT